MRQQRRGHHALQQLQLTDEIGVADVVQRERPALAGEPPWQTLAGGQPDRLHDLRCETAVGRDTKLARVGVGQQHGDAGGPHDIADGLEERVQHATQIEARREHATEGLEHARERGVVPRRLLGRAAARGRVWRR